jgi:thiol-disulfide isomerase/thioredoxin
MNSFRKNIELAANVAIVVTAVLLCAALFKSHFTTSPTPVAGDDQPNPNKEIRPKERVNLPEVDWRKNGQTLLLVLSTTCHYCSESTAFYQQLAKERDGKTRIIAALPQPSDEGREYLEKHGVTVNDIKQVELGSIGVSGTPTLILVDDGGVAEGVWVGKLTRADEAKVLNRIRQSVAQR